MKRTIMKILGWAFVALLNTGPLFAQYSNATMNGQWLFHGGPFSTANAEADTSLFYIGFDANGNITDWENFGWLEGTDSVTASGVVSVTLLIGNNSGALVDTAQFPPAQLTSHNYASMGPEKHFQ